MQLEAKLKLKRASSGRHLSMVMKKEGGGTVHIIEVSRNLCYVMPRLR